MLRFNHKNMDQLDIRVFTWIIVYCHVILDVSDID